MSVQEKIRKQVTDNHIVLYMKGTPEAPQCGFSATAVQILEACGAEAVATVDVLADQDVRQGIKAFSSSSARSRIRGLAVRQPFFFPLRDRKRARRRRPSEQLHRVLRGCRGLPLA